MRPELDVVSVETEPTPFVDDMVAHFAEWDALPKALKRNLNFDKYLTQKREHSRGRPTPDTRQRPRQNELKQATSKLTLDHFNGSGKTIARAWVHKLDTYISLRPMSEDAIRFVVLHLDGVARDWWYHGLVSLHHDHILQYQEFVDRLIERFDRKDPETYFRGLAQLRQTGGLEAFISEF